MVVIDWDEEKNLKLKMERGVGFEDVLMAIHEDRILGIFKHPNYEKYPEQKILVVEIGGYAYVVPFEERGEVIWLITIYPSRKMTMIYLGGKKDGERNKT